MSTEPVGGSAFAHRGSTVVYSLIDTWNDSQHDAIHVNWAKSAFDQLRPHSSGEAYLNFLGDEGPDRVRAAYGSSLASLSELKRRYDPSNMFRLNQSIAPA